VFNFDIVVVVELVVTVTIGLEGGTKLFVFVEKVVAFSSSSPSESNKASSSSSLLSEEEESDSEEE
jgi:hypothetical protein